MFNLNEAQQEMHRLLLEIKTYLGLQKHLIAVTATEKLIALLSTLAVATVCILFASIALLFSSFALAYWIGEAVGSLAIGFAIIAAVLIALLLIIYRNRHAWIVLPIARTIAAILIDNEEKDEDA